MEPIALLKKRRLPATTAALLIGVALAGVIASKLGSPKGESDYLHEHLSAVGESQSFEWSSVPFDLPPQDKTKIANIISKAERPNESARLKEILTGQALKTAQENICADEGKPCLFPARLNRKLSVAYLHKDMRVASVKETSRRVDLEVLPEGAGVSLGGIFDEIRILRFYQTQAGWVQNMAAVLQSEALHFQGREEQFSKRFAYKLTGLNYYPASASWADFWEVFPVEQIKTDLDAAKGLNVNALRIFLTHAYFEEAATAQDGLTKLKTFLDICAAKDIQVLLTLFDLRPDYTVAHWEADIAHIDGILRRVGEHEAILAIDLKNQADLDFKGWGQGQVEAWLTVMARHIQTYYPNLPVTTGWSHADNALRLKDVFDLVTYHEYQNPKGLDQRLGDISKAAQGKPVMITELGSTIWHPPFITRLGEKAQAKKLGQQLSQAVRANGVFVWTLNDFDHVGAEVVGRLPWRQAQQQHFGLVRPDGTLRPAATVLKDFSNRPQAKPTKKNTDLKHNTPFRRHP